MDVADEFFQHIRSLAGSYVSANFDTRLSIYERKQFAARARKEMKILAGRCGVPIDPYFYQLAKEAAGGP